MPYDPNLPQENTLIDAAQMRAQLQALNALIQARATPEYVTTAANAAQYAAIAASSSNSNAVATLGQFADGGYSQSQMQDVINKLDELIQALRR